MEMFAEHTYFTGFNCDFPQNLAKKLIDFPRKFSGFQHICFLILYNLSRKDQNKKIREDSLNWYMRRLGHADFQPSWLAIYIF